MLRLEGSQQPLGGTARSVVARPAVRPAQYCRERTLGGPYGLDGQRRRATDGSGQIGRRTVRFASFRGHFGTDAQKLSQRRKEKSTKNSCRLPCKEVDRAFGGGGIDVSKTPVPIERKI